MAEAIVQDWLSEYESLQPSELRTFASMHENNQEIADALYTIFNERLKYPDLIHSICNQFHSFYRSSEETLKRFTLQFIPILIYIYLNAVAMGDKKSCRSIETLLISIYNVEVSTEDGYQKIVSFRMPVLAHASIYHEEKSLHTTDLRRWEENCNREIKWGPLLQIESINAQNRMKVMAALLFAYNQQLSLIQKSALFHLCRIASQIVNQGFSKPGHAHRSSYGNDPNSAIAPKPLPRILLSSQFLLELVDSIYFAMFNEFGTIAIQTLEDIHHRACYEMFSDLILVTNAVRNSLHANPSGQPSDGPMGLSVALTPATTTVTVSKSMITNASFRTKKLPDDLDMEFLAKLPNQQSQPQLHPSSIIQSGNDRNDQIDELMNSFDEQQTALNAAVQKDRKFEGKNQRRWKNWGWKYSPGSKTSSIEEEPDSPKKSLSSSKNSSPNASPKIKKPQQQQLLKDQDQQQIVAALRRKKSQSPTAKQQTPETRSSAGARLCHTTDDSYEESGDERESLLGNGRPSSIHIIQTSSDDIPIQGAKEEIQQTAGLMSITEESPDQSTIMQTTLPTTTASTTGSTTAGTGTTIIGGRNTGIRSSKEGIKPHAKALIAGFKKSKDKEKEKEKDKVSNDIKENSAKPPTRKEKSSSNRNSIQLSGGGGSGDSGGDFDKSPLPMLKSKILDGSSSNGGIQVNTNEFVPLQHLPNGSLIAGDDKKSDSIDNSCDISDSIGSSTDHSSTTQRPSLTLVEPHQVQISQV